MSAWVLKAVYFPDSTFLKASLGSRLSRIWRALGREDLQQGLTRRIGTGEKTMI